MTTNDKSRTLSGPAPTSKLFQDYEHETNPVIKCTKREIISNRIDRALSDNERQDIHMRSLEERIAKLESRVGKQ